MMMVVKQYYCILLSGPIPLCSGTWTFPPRDMTREGRQATTTTHHWLSDDNNSSSGGLCQDKFQKSVPESWSMFPEKIVVPFIASFEGRGALYTPFLFLILEGKCELISGFLWKKFWSVCFSTFFLGEGLKGMYFRFLQQNFFFCVASLNHTIYL